MFSTVPNSTPFLPSLDHTKGFAMRSRPDDTVFDKVVLAVQQTVYVDGHGLTPATRIAGDLGVGRFGRIKLALYLEETFDVEIPDEVVGRFDTVGDIVRYLSRWSHETGELSAQPVATGRPWIGA
jgi:acyl carrier protein